MIAGGPADILEDVHGVASPSDPSKLFQTTVFLGGLWQVYQLLQGVEMKPRKLQ